MLLKKKNWNHFNKRISEIQDVLDEKTILSLLFIRLVSDSYYPPLYQFTIKDCCLGHLFSDTAGQTPWDIIMNNKEGDINDAIKRALGAAKLIVPGLRAFNEIEFTIPKNQTAMIEFLNLLSELEFVDECSQNGENPFQLLFEAILKSSAKKKINAYGDYYTSDLLIHCLAMLLSPESGNLYDPCCGSGALLLGAANAAKKGSKIKLYGQVRNIESYIMCQINQRLHKVEIEIGENYEDSLDYDQFKHNKFKFIIANPPFNGSGSSSNFDWLQHVLDHLDEQGKAVILMPNGTLANQNRLARDIRKEIVETGTLESIITFPAGLFYNTNIPFCIWMFHKENKERNTVLFISAESLEPRIDKPAPFKLYAYLMELLTSYRAGSLSLKSTVYAVASIEEIANENYILSPNLYTKSKYGHLISVQDTTLQLIDSIHTLQEIFKDDLLHDLLDQWKHQDLNTGWECDPLMELYDIFGGLTRNKEAFGDGYPVLDVKTIVHNMFVPDTFETFANVTEDELQKYSIQHGDIFLNRTSESAAELACGCVSVNNLNAVYTGFAKRLRPKNKQTVYAPYIAGYLRSGVFRKQVMDVSTEFTTRASIDNHKLSKLRIYYPSWELQMQIGDTLYSIFNKQRENLDREQQSLLHDFQEMFIAQVISSPIIRFMKQ